MKAHVTKPTAPIKMPQYKAKNLPAAPKPKAPAKPHTAKSTTPSPSVKLPTIPQHREKLAGMVPSVPKKGKT